MPNSDAVVTSRSTLDLLAELEALRAEVRLQPPDLTAEQAEQFALRITRDPIDALVEKGEVSFQREAVTADDRLSARGGTQWHR